MVRGWWSHIGLHRCLEYGDGNGSRRCCWKQLYHSRACIGPPLNSPSSAGPAKQNFDGRESRERFCGIGEHGETGGSLVAVEKVDAPDKYSSFEVDGSPVVALIVEVGAPGVNDEEDKAIWLFLL